MGGTGARLERTAFWLDGLDEEGNTEEGQTEPGGLYRIQSRVVVI
jgi:hypothetical protein